jgi:hypothetical protein
MIENLDKSSSADLPRSNSNSSLDGIVTAENICAIRFSESFPYKNGLIDAIDSSDVNIDRIRSVNESNYLVGYERWFSTGCQFEHHP